MTGNECGDVLLCKRHEQVYNIRCPGILGQHYADALQALQKRYLEAKNFLIIDWSEVCDSSKVVQGAKATQYIFNSNNEENSLNVEICNIFFADDEGEFVQVNRCIISEQILEEVF